MDKYAKLHFAEARMRPVVPLVLLCTLFVDACQPADPPKACPEIPVVDGFRTVVGEGGKVTLRVPQFAEITLSRDCKVARSIWLDYLWHDEKLVSEGANRFAYPENERFHIRVGIQSFRSKAEFMDKTQPWQVEGAVRHQRYALEFYPRYYWQADGKPPIKAPLEHTWGIVGTRNPITGRPYEAWCTIVPPEFGDASTSANGDFAAFGDSKCRGYLRAVSGERAVGAMIDVWAVSAPYIDKIYNAAQAELETYIKEDRQ